MRIYGWTTTGRRHSQCIGFSSADEHIIVTPPVAAVVEVKHSGQDVVRTPSLRCHWFPAPAFTENNEILLLGNGKTPGVQLEA